MSKEGKAVHHPTNHASQMRFIVGTSLVTNMPQRLFTLGLQQKFLHICAKVPQKTKQDPPMELPCAKYGETKKCVHHMAKAPLSPRTEMDACCACDTLP